jgi:dihydropteroate synthase
MATPTGLMGIVNVTPDSFFDGGEFADAEAAAAQAARLVKAGAAIVDVGGESTRPGSSPVATEVELERVIPTVELISRSAVISVDTSKAEVARQALAAGATIVNDVSAFRRDPDLGAVCAEHDAIVILMHSPDGWPDPTPPPYDDVIDWVKSSLTSSIEAAVGLGVSEDRIWLDPGIGFGKVNPEGNLEILRRLAELTDLERPLVVGPSRKAFIGRLDGSSPANRLGGTIAACLIAAANGARVLRVHDVGDVAQALAVTASALEDSRFFVPRQRLPER